MDKDTDQDQDQDPSLTIFILDNWFQDHFFHFFEIQIDNKVVNVDVNYRPRQFKYVFAYFGDKYYPASTAQVRNFYACQGKEHSFLNQDTSASRVTLEDSLPTYWNILLDII